MTTVNSILGPIITESPKAEVIRRENVVLKRRGKRVIKGAGAKLSYADFARFAERNRPPQSWYDETNGNG